MGAAIGDQPEDFVFWRCGSPGQSGRPARILLGGLVQQVPY